MTYIKHWATVLGIALFLFSQSASAHDSHYQNYIVGERAVGFGGAFTAISDDASGAYYNPAGLALIPNSSFNLSSSIYGFSRQNYEASSLDFFSENRNFVSYPTSAAWQQRLRSGDADGVGRLQGVFTILTPQSEVSRKRLALVNAPEPIDDAPGQTQLSTKLELTTDIAEGDTVWFGLAIGYKARRWLSVGASVFYTIRSAFYQTYAPSLINITENDQELARVATAEHLDIDVTHNGLLAMVGALVPITERLRVGATFRSPQLKVRSKASATYFATEYNEASKSYKVSSYDYNDLIFQDRQPFKASLGVAYLIPQRLGLASDISLYGGSAEFPAFSSPSDPEIAEAVKLKRRMIVQINAGGEFYLRRSFPARLGFFTNLSALERRRQCDENGNCYEVVNMFSDPTNMYGFSGSLGYEIEKATLTIGGSYCFGRSQSTVENNVQLQMTRSFLFLSLGGSFRF